MKPKQPRPTMTETLRAAIVASEVPLLRLEQETGVSRMRSVAVHCAATLARCVSTWRTSWQPTFDLELSKKE